jgi:hypothetical protein
MQIGGTDLTFKAGPLIEELTHRIVQAIFTVWTEGVIEGVSTSALELKDLFGNTHPEIFVYKNQAAKASWDADGWTEEHCKSMINVMTHADTGEGTLVVEDPKDPEMSRILEAIRLTIES